MMLFLLIFLFVFGCESNSRDDRYYYGGYEGEYRAIIERIRDVPVDNTFEVRAKLKDHHNDVFTERRTIAIRLTGGDSRARLRGDTQKETRNGRVVFSNLRIDREGRNYRIESLFKVNGQKFYDRSNKFDVIDDDGDDDDGISIGGSLFSVDLEGLPDDIVAGEALPNLTFTMKLLGNKSTGGTVKLKVKDYRGRTVDDALVVWRKPELSATVRSGKAVFAEAFFTQALEEDAELVATAVRFVGTKKFTLPRVHRGDIDVDISRITTNAGSTEVRGTVWVDGAECSNCTLNAYLISNDKVKDASATTTDSRGSFTAAIPTWSCVSGTVYSGAVKVVQRGNRYYALAQGNCD